MQSSQENHPDLEKCTVAIENPGTGKVLGTGVIVTDDGLIVTCYHVIGNIRTKTLDYKTVDIYFPSNPNARGNANVLEEYCDASSDIAFLQLQEELPEQVAVANLSETIDHTHTFRSFGFRRPIEVRGLNAAGEIRGKVSKKPIQNNDLHEIIQLHSNQIGPGMSGAPVLDKNINRVIGIVSEHYRSQSDVDNNLSFAIPVQSIIQVYPEIKQKNLGLRILEFLRKIGEERVKKYERIDELYVPPVNYDEIKQTLQMDQVLFLTGTQEYGKTYTAVHFLLEYFNKGYEPVWYKGDEDKEERGRRNEVRNKFTNIEKYLKPHHIIYFEDPFGKTEYEVNVDEAIVRNIASIIETVENTEDTYVVITSREEVFKQFGQKIMAEVDLTQYEKKLNMKRSYNYEKRKELLLGHAKIMNCKWFENKDLVDFVLDVLKDETKLPTPLNIKDFANATKNILLQSEILKKINSKSKETTMSFAEEIRTMSIDKILFLSLPFISGYFLVDFVKDSYEKLLRKFNFEEQDAWEFDRILKWFKDDKIDISYVKGREKEIIWFSHPSYSEAFKFAICENHTIRVRNIFSDVLINLADNRPVVEEISFVIADNFDRLPEKVQNVLFKLGTNQETAWSVPGALVKNYDRLPQEFRSLLFNLAEDIETGWIVAYYIDRNHSISEELKNNLNDCIRM